MKSSTIRYYACYDSSRKQLLNTIVLCSLRESIAPLLQTHVIVTCRAVSENANSQLLIEVVQSTIKLSPCENKRSVASSSFPLRL
jgi:hypothetical protein